MLLIKCKQICHPNFGWFFGRDFESYFRPGCSAECEESTSVRLLRLAIFTEPFFTVLSNLNVYTFTFNTTQQYLH